MKTPEEFKLWQALNIPKHEYSEIISRIGREPNDLETYLFSAMWSEHCGYKHTRKYLSRFPKANSVLADENAGGVKIGNHIVFFKVESHNHPSAVEPFQGAATGIGGIIRDVLALGARPIALLDSLKFGKLTNSNTKHLLNGVVDGISAYGNSIGVPTVAGEIGFDKNYTDSPLVNVMAVGIVHKDDIKISAAPTGNIVLIVGSYTGRDGIHGASFASKELDENSKEDRPSVQVGDPFTKKVLIEATLEILKLKEVLACQDCGAAGILSSTSEMAYKGNCGINLYLEKIHLRENGMKPWEIMLSESQERMIFIVKPNASDKIIEICKKYDLPVSEFGETNDTNNYDLYWYGEKQCSLSPEVLNKGPEYTLEETEPQYIDEYRNKKFQCECSVEEIAELIVKDENFASKNWAYSQYDHMVGNRTVATPGQSGAAGLWLHEESGVLGLTIDSLPRQVFLDPYAGSQNTVWESFRNLVSSGFTPLGLTDCLNYGNPEKAEVGYQIVKSIDGISKACKDASIPVVSGNVSLYNESPDYRVYPTPTIGMVGYCKSTKQVLKGAFNENDTVILIGKDINEDSNIGGSLYQRITNDFIGGKVDTPNPKIELQLMNIIFELRDKALINSCIDISEGGLFGGIFEGLCQNRLGFTGNFLSSNNHNNELFGEINGRYIISTKNYDQITKILTKNKVEHKILGKCVGDNIEINGYCLNKEKLFDLYYNSIEAKMSE